MPVVVPVVRMNNLLISIVAIEVLQPGCTSPYISRLVVKLEVNVVGIPEYDPRGMAR